MRDYIKIEEAAKALSLQTPYSYNDCLNMLANGIAKGYAKAAAVRENVQGVWVFDDNWWDYVCTNCRGRIGNIKKYKFCPHCGARMIGVE